MDNAAPVVDPPVILVHGWGGSYSHTWKGSSLESQLTKAGRRVLGIDLLGHGRAPAPHDPAAYTDLGGDLLRRLPATGLLDVVGFSLGGKLSLRLAAQYPHRFRRLAILGVGENLFRPENGSAVSEALFAGVTDDMSPVLRPVIEDALASGNDLHALSAAIRRPPDALAPADLWSVTAAVLLIVGECDHIAGTVEPLECALPHARVAKIPGLEHVHTPNSPLAQRHAADFIGQRTPARS